MGFLSHCFSFNLVDGYLAPAIHKLLKEGGAKSTTFVQKKKNFVEHRRRRSQSFTEAPALPPHYRAGDRGYSERHAQAAGEIEEARWLHLAFPFVGGGEQR